MCENLVQIGWGFQELSFGKTKWHADENTDADAVSLNIVCFLSSQERENFHLQEKRKTLLAIIFSSLSSSYFVLEKLYHLTLLVCVSVYVSILFQTVDNN